MICAKAVYNAEWVEEARISRLGAQEKEKWYIFLLVSPRTHARDLTPSTTPNFFLKKLSLSVFEIML